jgi:hypothetical protein
MRRLRESDLLKPGKPARPQHRLNKVHRCVLAQIYGESSNILRANPPVWKCAHNLQIAAWLERLLRLYLPYLEMMRQQQRDDWEEWEREIGAR